MHAEVTEFLRSATEVEWEGASVYEVGSADWNGRAADYVPTGWVSWIGIDIAAAPNVDLVGDARKVLPMLMPCDVVVSTEVFEHVEDWRGIVAAMAGALAPSGWFVATCAGTGRPPHGAEGHPLRPDEYYANVSLAELAEACEAVGVVMVRGEEGAPGDTRFIGRKA